MADYKLCEQLRSIVSILAKAEAELRQISEQLNRNAMESFASRRQQALENYRIEYEQKFGHIVNHSSGEDEDQIDGHVTDISTI